MNLDSSTRKLQIVLGTAKTTSDMPVVVDYISKTYPQETNLSYLSKSNGTTPVDILPAPDPQYQKVITAINVFNADTALKQVTIQYLDTATAYPEVVINLNPGDTLGYTLNQGWYTQDSSGNLKTIISPSAPVSGFVTVDSSASPDIFGAAGATISINNSTPVTTTSFTACTSAQVGSVKRVTPVQNWSVTASANLVVDGATSGTFVMPAGRLLEVLASTTTLFKLSRAHTLSTPEITIYTSGSGTYTTPAGAKYLTVKMVGGGGGGAGSTSTVANNATNGGAGTATTFGTSLLLAGFGLGGSVIGGSGIGVTGGTATITAPAIGYTATGEGGSGVMVSTPAGIFCPGGNGGSSKLGTGGIAKTNSAGLTGLQGGGGGGGGSTNGVVTLIGGGGSAGGFVDAIIPAPSATYAYVVGTGGTAGAAGTSGYVGGTGGDGIIIITAYF